MLFCSFFSSIFPTLQHLGGGVVVEGDVGDGVVLVVKQRQLVANQHRLAGSRVPHQHHRPPFLHQQVHEELHPDRLRVVDQLRLFDWWIVFDHGL